MVPSPLFLQSKQRPRVFRGVMVFWACRCMSLDIRAENHDLGRRFSVLRAFCSTPSDRVSHTHTRPFGFPPCLQSGQFLGHAGEINAPTEGPHIGRNWHHPPTPLVPIAKRPREESPSKISVFDFFDAILRRSVFVLEGGGAFISRCGAPRSHGDKTPTEGCAALRRVIFLVRRA